LSIMLMAFFATMLCKLLTRYQWISYIGVLVLLVVATEMLYSSWEHMEKMIGIG
jgi:predicted tellurium resistance membrane protein TerC